MASAMPSSMSSFKSDEPVSSKPPNSTKAPWPWWMKPRPSGCMPPWVPGLKPSPVASAPTTLARHSDPSSGGQAGLHRRVRDDSTLGANLAHDIRARRHPLSTRPLPRQADPPRPLHDWSAPCQRTMWHLPGGPRWGLEPQDLDLEPCGPGQSVVSEGPTSGTAKRPRPFLAGAEVMRRSGGQVALKPLGMLFASSATVRAFWSFVDGHVDRSLP